MTNDNQGRDSARGLGVPRFAPGMTCVVIDHPLWKNPVKRLILGCHVVLLSRVYVPSKYSIRASDYGWHVSGMPPAFLAARRRQTPDFGGCLSEDILEPLPPIGLIKSELDELLDTFPTEETIDV